MTLKERIQEDRKLAMRNKESDKRRVLTTLFGELDRMTKLENGVQVPIKNPTDEQVIPVIKKMIENNTLTNTTEENVYLGVYLPPTMSEEELRFVIQPYIDENGLTSPKSMGLVMNFLKNNYTGQYDGKLASQIVKEILNGN